MIYVIEIPHQRRARVLVFKDKKAFDAACRETLNMRENENYSYDTYDSLKEAKDAYDDDLPSGLASILEKGPAVEICDMSGRRFLPKGKAPTIEDFGLEVWSHDLSGLRVLESDEEAKEYLNTVSGHKSIEQKVELKKVLEREGVIKEDVVEEEG